MNRPSSEAGSRKARLLCVRCFDLSARGSSGPGALIIVPAIDCVIVQLSTVTAMSMATTII